MSPIIVVKMSAIATEATVLLARQPIYDRKLRVHGYELLYRRAGQAGAGNVGPSESAATLVRAIVEIGLDKLVGDKPAFINIPHYLLHDPALHLLPKDRVVLEILEDTEPTDQTLSAAAELCEAGFKLALDDYVFGSPLIEFLPYAKIVKIDLLQNKPGMLTAALKIFKSARVRILAEKVETMEMFAKCQALGCNYFQGYFLSKPEVVEGKGVPSSRVNLVHLLNRLQDPRVTLSQLELIISNDVGLTYRLLRMVNSALIAANECVESVKGALMVLGLERVRAIVSLLALAGIEGKPSDLLVTAMIRAKMCEGIADALGYREEGKAFTVGLLSVLDAMFDTPMEEILSEIPLSEDIKVALIRSNPGTPLTETLNTALAYEVGDWEALGEGFSQNSITSCYLQAVEWADQADICLAA